MEQRVNPSEKKVTEFRKRILKWFKTNSREFPWRGHNRSAYELLVAEILLQRTRAENVVNVYLDFIEKYPNFRKLSEAKISELEYLLKPIGLYRSRSRNLVKLGKLLLDTEGGLEARTELKSLPGVGPYIANTFLLIAFNKRLGAVDTNVRRLYGRVFSVKSRTDAGGDERVWKFAGEMLPHRRYKEFMLAILDFSALVCKKKSPKCDSCALNDICDCYENRNLQI